MTGCGIPIGGVGLDGLDGPPGIVDGSVARLLSNSVGSMIENDVVASTAAIAVDT